MANSEEQPRYKNFLLTVWKERNLEPHQSVVWRFALQDPHTGQRRAFSGLEALCDALRRMISAAEATEQSQPSFTSPIAESSDPDDESSLSRGNEKSEKRKK